MKSKGGIRHPRGSSIGLKDERKNKIKKKQRKS